MNSSTPEFTITRVELPDVPRVPLGTVLHALIFGYAALDIDATPSGIHTNIVHDRGHLFLGFDGHYRFGILPAHDGEPLVEMDGAEWTAAQELHHRRAREAASEEDRRRAKLTGKAERAAGALAKHKVTLCDAFARRHQGDPGHEVVREAIQSMRREKDYLAGLRSLLAAPAHPVDLRPPSRTTAFVHILRGPHRDQVAREGFATEGDLDTELKPFHHAAELWLADFGRRGKLNFYGRRSVVPIDVEPGPSGARVELIPETDFDGPVGFDGDTDRIDTISALSGDTERFAELAESDEPAADLVAWTNVRVDLAQFKKLWGGRPFDYSSIDSERQTLAPSSNVHKATTSADERKAIRILSEALKIDADMARDRAATIIGHPVGSRPFRRIWREARKLAGLPETADSGRRKGDRNRGAKNGGAKNGGANY